MNKRNFQREMDALLESVSKQPLKRLLLHSCCAPCSSYVLEYLSRYFEITVLYFNPNITSAGEYNLRLGEQRRLCAQMPMPNSVSVIAGEYAPEQFFSAVKGLENEPEGGARCRKCFELRLSYTARLAKEGKYAFFATTLTLSPLKNAAVINEIGESIASEYGVPYLCSDFKKREGYKRSLVLSAEYKLYRQNYCGCVFSRRAEEKKREEKEKARRA